MALFSNFQKSKGAGSGGEGEKPEGSKLASSKLQAYLDHPSVDTSCRFAVDRLFRMLGYRIHSRPKKGETSWLGLDRRVYTRSSILKRLGKNSSFKSLLQDAEYAEELYLDTRYPDDLLLLMNIEQDLRELLSKQVGEEMDKQIELGKPAKKNKRGK